MSVRAPSDRILNHVVTVKRKLDGCDAFGPLSSHRAALRPMSDQEKVVLQFEVTQSRMKVYFRDDVDLVKGDRIEYTDNRGQARYVRVDGAVVDEKMLGRLYKAEGSDFPVE